MCAFRAWTTSLNTSGHTPLLVSSAQQAGGRGGSQHFLSSRPECYRHLKQCGCFHIKEEAQRPCPRAGVEVGTSCRILPTPSLRLSSSGGVLCLLKHDPILFDHYSEESVPGSHASPRLRRLWRDPSSWLPQTLLWPLRRLCGDHLLMTTLKSTSSAPPLSSTAHCPSPNFTVNITLAYYLMALPVLVPCLE